MILQLVISFLLCFGLLAGLMVFYIKHQSKVPYYRLNQNDCVALLDKAVKGELLEREWNVFIGMSVQGSEEFEQLRTVCLIIDDECKKGTQLVEGELCIRFNKAGVSQLNDLLDEWRHKVNYAA